MRILNRNRIHSNAKTCTCGARIYCFHNSPSYCKSTFISTNSVYSIYAFTVLELLVVMGIVGLLATLAIPAFSSLAKSAALAQASQSILDQLNLARSRAFATGKNQQIRFYEYVDKDQAGSTPYFRAIQSFEQVIDGSSDNGKFTPVGPLVKLPTSVVIDDALIKAPLSGATATHGPFYALSTNDITENAEKRVANSVKSGTPAYQSYGFNFQASGSTDLDKNPTREWYITVRHLADNPNASSTAEEIVALRDYILIQIDPYTGVTRAFRKGN